LKVIDATCPLVTKVHREAIKYARMGYTIVLIGHSDHDEVIGTLEKLPVLSLSLILRKVDGLLIPDPTKVAYLTQTTLSLNDTRRIVDKCASGSPDKSSGAEIFVTRRSIARVPCWTRSEADLILVVGSANSSNSVVW